MPTSISQHSISISPGRARSIPGEESSCRMSVTDRPTERGSAGLALPNTPGVLEATVAANGRDHGLVTPLPPIGQLTPPGDVGEDEEDEGDSASGEAGREEAALRDRSDQSEEHAEEGEDASHPGHDDGCGGCLRPYLLPWHHLRPAGRTVRMAILYSSFATLAIGQLITLHGHQGTMTRSLRPGYR